MGEEVRWDFGLLRWDGGGLGGLGLKAILREGFLVHNFRY